MLSSLARFWRPETGIFLAVWLLLLAGGRSRLLRDPGTFWHTRVGDIMLTTGALVRHDPFAFTPPDRPWIPHQWLGECVMALLHRIDGLDTLVLATATILALLYAWLAGRLMRAGLHWSLAGVLVLAIVAVSTSHFHARPHLATIVLLGLTFAWLADFEAARITLRRLWWLVPIYILWSNIHGGVLGGLVTMAAAGVGWIAWRFLRLDSPLAGRREIIDFGLLLVACGLTTLVNPFGIELPRTWLSIMDSELLPQIIQEHARMDPTKLDGMAVLGLAALYAAVLLNLKRWPRVTWLLPLLWLEQACSRIRHAPLFAIVAGLAIAEMIPYTRWAAARLASGSDLFTTPAPSTPTGWRPWLLPATSILAAFVLQAAGIEAPLVGHGWAQLDDTLWPVELNPELAELRREPDGTRIFNDLTYGGYLIYYVPNLRVFVDDRCELHDPRWLKEYVDADRDRDDQKLAAWQQQWGFTLALVQTGSGSDLHFAAAPDWTIIKRTDTATLYRRISRQGARAPERSSWRSCVPGVRFSQCWYAATSPAIRTPRNVTRTIAT